MFATTSVTNPARFGWGGNKPLPTPQEYVVYGDTLHGTKLVEALEKRLYDGGDDNLGFAVVSRRLSNISPRAIMNWLSDLGRRQARRVFEAFPPADQAGKNVISHHAFEAERGAFWNLTPLPDFPGIELAALQSIPDPSGVPQIPDYFYVVDVDQYCKDNKLKLKDVTNGAGRIGILAPEKRRYFEDVIKAPLSPEEREMDILLGTERKSEARKLLSSDTHARKLLDKYAVKIDASTVDGNTPVLVARAGRRLFAAHPTWTSDLTDASAQAARAEDALDEPWKYRDFREYMQEITVLDSDELNGQMKDYWRQHATAFLEAPQAGGEG